jgi:hypothetical protein
MKFRADLAACSEDARRPNAANGSATEVDERYCDYLIILATLNRHAQQEKHDGAAGYFEKSD